MTIDMPRSKAALRRLWQEAFGDPDSFIDSFFAKGFHRERCLCAYEHDDLAGMLYWFDCQPDGQKLAYLYAVATANAHRGKGICRQLMAHTHAHLRQLGYAGAVLVPGSRELFAMYEKFGYRPFGGVNKFTCAAAKQDVALQPVDGQTYARLRRQLLPTGGVVQEDCLAFLAEFTEFYAGDGFVLYASREGNTLFCGELLGDPAAAAGIVTALGCTEGHFRTPGADNFAMYLPFADNAVPPAYFGIPLD